MKYLLLIALVACGNHKDDKVTKHKIDSEEILPIVTVHCMHCHATLPEDTALIIKKLKNKSMPPPKVSKLSDKDRQLLIDYLEQDGVNRQH